jgi:hypothetical protein
LTRDVTDGFREGLTFSGFGWSTYARISLGSI